MVTYGDAETASATLRAGIAGFAYSEEDQRLVSPFGTQDHGNKRIINDHTEAMWMKTVEVRQ